MSRPSIVITDDGIRLHIKWTCEDSSEWRAILESFKLCFWHHEDRLYSSVTKTWSVPAWHRGRLCKWVDGWFDDDCQRWDYTRTYSSRSSGERTYRGNSSSGSQHGGGRTSTRSDGVAAAYAALHLLPTAPLWAAEAVYRAAVKVCHPDAGGSHEAAVVINRAVEEIRRHQEAAHV